MPPKRRSKKTPDNIRCLIISLYRRKFSVTAIAKLVNMARTTVSTIVSTWIKEGRVHQIRRGGRRRKLSPRGIRRLRLLILVNRFWTRRRTYETFKESYGYQISFRTFMRYCRKVGAHRAPNCKKEVLTERHRRIRIGWVRTRKFWTVNDWKKVIFSDECSVKIGADKRVYVWKMNDEGYYRPDLYILSALLLYKLFEL